MKIIRIVAVLFLVIATCVSLRAQTVRAQLTGFVTDPSGAAVPAAEVVATNTLTGVKVSVPTNGLGLYTILDLEPGTYQLQVQKTGFATALRRDIQLTVGQSARTDVKLSIGQVSQNVEVTGEPPLLQTEDSSLGALVANKEVVNMPLNGRDPMQMIDLVPGVAPQVGNNQTDGSYATRVTNQGVYQTLFSINGGPILTNEILIDGTPNTIPVHGQLAFTPSVDSIQEFRVLTSTFSAEYGRTGGGVVLIDTKSGTNDFHGTLYEFLRNEALDANTFFNNQAGIARPAFKFNDYGGAIDGPVWIPHLYNGHDKTFFFFSFDGQKVKQNPSFQTTVPTALQRTGDFSQTFTASGQLIKIYDPATTQQTSPGVYVRSPFPGNKIPASRLDPVAVNAAAYFPLPNQPGRPLTNVNNFSTTASQLNTLKTYQARVDHYVGGNHIFVEFNHDLVSDTPANFFHNIATSNSNGPSTQPDNIVTLGVSHSLSPNLLLVAHLGYTSGLFNRTSESAGFDYSQLGFPSALNSELQTREFPTIHISGMGELGPYLGAIYKLDSQVWSTSAALTYIHGRHTIHVGADWRAYLLNVTWDLYGNGSYIFNNGFTQGPNPAASSATAGFGFASFMLGAPSSGTAAFYPEPAFANKYFAPFVQDDFHVTHKLTLNLGLRYDYETPRTDRFNRLSFFNPTLSNPIGLQVGLPNLEGGLEFVGVNGNPRGQADPDRNNFGPRLGFAYMLRPSIVIRGGYSILYLPNGTEQNFTSGMDGFSTQTSQLTQNPNFTQANPLSNPFPAGLLQPTGSSLGSQTLLGQSIGGFLRWMPVPYMQQYDINAQWQLPGATLVEVGYIGSHGTELFSTTALDQLPDQDLSLGNTLLQLVPNPFYGIVTSGPLSTPTISEGQLLRPFPQYTAVNHTQLPVSGGFSSYNSLQLTASHRIGGGLAILGGYVWSKQISNVWVNYSSGGQIQDSNNLNAERSIDPMNTPQRLIVSAVYSLPFGPGEKWLGSAHGALARLSGGWKFSGIATVQSGRTISLQTSVNNTHANGLVSRPNSNGQSAKLSHPTINQWFNTSDFSLPAPFTYGNAARVLTDVRSDATKNLDFSVLKNTTIRENLSIEFRAESFNLLNRPQFGLPGTSLGTTSFGVVSDQANSPRQIQLSLKLLF